MRCRERTRTGSRSGVALWMALTALGCQGEEALPPRGNAGDASWHLVWQDEFDGPAGSLPDSSRWRFDVGTDWGNAQLEHDTARPRNVALSGDGHLAIVAHREEYLGSGYTSGRIQTHGRFARTGGRFEARLRVPRGPGLWPAFWLLGADFPQVGWPACGEIDILEFRGQEPFVVHGSLHGPGFSGARAMTGRYEAPVPLDSGFHVVAVEWKQEEIVWFLDGVAYQIVRPADLPPGGRWVFDHPFFLILNLAVGGHFVGPPDSTTAFPATLLVDWVRVYEEREP